MRTRDIHKNENYPVCEGLKCNYFIRNKLYFKNYDADKFSKVITEAVQKGEKVIAVKMANESLYNLVVDKLCKNRGASDIIKAAGGNTDGYYYTNDELYILRFKID